MTADRLIVALDFTDSAEALAMAKRLRGLVRTLKIGSALFTACGPRVIEQVQALGFDVMLDLKFFDIPSTVELSCRAAAAQQVALLTVHAAGGPAMLKAAVRGARDASRRLRLKRPRILGVTVLTSVGGDASGKVRSRVLTLAQDARRAGCDGIVASAREAAWLRKRFRATLDLVCPGIRPASASKGDQQRVATPAAALAAGADWLVVGRPITAARNPRAAARAILREMEGTRC